MAIARKSGTIYLIIAFLLSFLFSPLTFAYPTAKELDKFWEQRQPTENQKKIIKFLKTTEAVPKDFEVAWRVARLVYFVGNFGIGFQSLTKKEKVEIFKYGYEAADIARTLKPDRVEGHYWYGTNLGSFGISKGVLAALGHAEEGRDALIKAIEIDPTYHWGGPYRTLGRYYQETPAFISFGNKKKAEECFNKALEIAPEFRLNIIDLGVLKKEEGKTKLALELLEKAQKTRKLDGELEEKRYLVELAQGIKTLKEEERE